MCWYDYVSSPVNSMSPGLEGEKKPDPDEKNIDI